MRSFSCLTVLGRGALVWVLLAVPGCETKPDDWETIGELCEMDGSRYLVRQQHYDWVEGWKVSFGYTDELGTRYRYYLANESPRWGNVRLEATNGVIRVLMSNGDHVATFQPSNSLFINHLNGVTYDTESGEEGGKHPKNFWDETIRSPK